MKAKKKMKKKAVAPKAVRPKGRLVGRVTHYYDKIKVAVIRFSVPVKKGDKVRFEGGDTLFSQTLGSMEKDHKKIAKAGKGQEVGVRVAKQVREGYRVFR